MMPEVLMISEILEMSFFYVLVILISNISPHPLAISADPSSASSPSPGGAETPSAPGTLTTLEEGEAYLRADSHFQSTRQISFFISPNNGHFASLQMTIASLVGKECSQKYLSLLLNIK